MLMFWLVSRSVVVVVVIVEGVVAVKVVMVMVTPLWTMVVLCDVLYALPASECSGPSSISEETRVSRVRALHGC